ncbi:recombinase family protein [Enterococcus faecium]|uniref:recombinase family protein n=1 Tax=Enterococcus faecium TaxID=1352 RepID=UPI000CF02754|nr:recombinase family protein [Enterococcus faecium]PQC93476.1 recombinase family protein [Enterococcus faecium]
MRTGLYVRVSTAEQEKHGYSIKVQLEKLRAFASAKDYAVVKEYVDAAQSGAKLERPGLKQLIKDVQNDVLDCVLVYRLDRLSRSQKDTMYLIEDVFLKNNVAFVSLQESFDTTSSFGRAMVGMLSVFAQLERDNITERLLSGRVHRAKRGFHHGGGIIPFGYRYDVESGELKRFKNEFEEVKTMFEMIASGKSVSSVAKEFNTYDTTIRRRIVNPVYIGKIQFDGETFDGQHEPIVSEELFKKANAKMNARVSSLPFKRIYLLSGLIYCGKCNERCSAYESRSKHNGKEYRRAYYRCNARTWKYKQKHGRTCEQPHIRVDELEQAVMEQVKRLPLKRKVKKRAFDFKPIENKIATIDKQKERLLDLYLNEHLDSEMFNKKSKELDKTREKLTKQLESLRIQSAEAVESYQWLDEVNWDNLDKDTLREILERVIQKIVIRDGDIAVHLK